MSTGLFFISLLVLPIAGTVFIVIAIQRHRHDLSLIWGAHALAVSAFLSLAIPTILLLLCLLHILSYRVPQALIYIPLLVGVLLALRTLVLAPRQLRPFFVGLLLVQVSFTMLVSMFTALATLAD
jgi:hypothetical protein